MRSQGMEMLSDCVFSLSVQGDEWVCKVDKFPDVVVFEDIAEHALLQTMMVAISLRTQQLTPISHCDFHGDYTLTEDEIRNGEGCPTCIEDDSYCQAAEEAKFPQVNHFFNELKNKLP